jgi:hypothetical protein
MMRPQNRRFCALSAPSLRINFSRHRTREIDHLKCGEVCVPRGQSAPNSSAGQFPRWTEPGINYLENQSESF